MASVNSSRIFDLLYQPFSHTYIFSKSSNAILAPPIAAATVFTAVLLIYVLLLEPLLFGSLAHVPGPKLAGLSWYYLSYFDLKLCRNEKIGEWHRRYGPG